MSSQTEMGLSCPVCQDVFRDPVVLLCSHNVCRDCLESWWRETEVQRCPVCQEVSLQNDPPSNLKLKNRCETYILDLWKKAFEPPCSLHEEELKLFCVDHQELVCLVCKDSKSHSNHMIKPVAEAAEDSREELQRALKPLQDKLDLLKRAKEKFDGAEGHIQVQAARTESRIRETFQKLHEFLKEEEEARMEALREEEEQKSQMMKERITAVNRETAALSLTIRETEEQLRDEDVSFLLHYKATVEAVQQRPLVEDPQLPSGALIDVAKHLGNLSFNIWKKMKDQVSYSPVILDPNTADPVLLVSEDLTGVRVRYTQELPENPERQEHRGLVLGSEDLSSGSHSWDVDVSNSKDWRVGVVTSFVWEFEKVMFYREICLKDGKYRAVCNRDKKPSDIPGSRSYSKFKYSVVNLSDEVLSLKKKLMTIRVHLDCDKKKVSFSDPDRKTHIYTSNHFPTEQLFPYVHTSGYKPLKILPVSFSAIVQLLSV